MLASPSENTEDIIKWPDSKDIPLWLEPKYDGIRSQLHVTPNGAHLFSRDLRSLNNEFPEILEAARALPSCLVDGGLMADAEGKRVTFFDLQKRLGRKKIQGDLFLRKPYLTSFLLVFLFLIKSINCSSPNIILILADDLGTIHKRR